MERTLRMSLLFDFYGPLLTDRQQDVFQMYFHEDLSLGEIGEQLEVSRQAIYDMLKRAEAIFEEFEGKLALVARHLERQESFTEILNLVAQLKGKGQISEGLVQELEDKIRSAQTKA